MAKGLVLVSLRALRRILEVERYGGDEAQRHHIQVHIAIYVFKRPYWRHTCLYEALLTCVTVPPQHVGSGTVGANADHERMRRNCSRESKGGELFAASLLHRCYYCYCFVIIFHQIMIVSIS